MSTAPLSQRTAQREATRAAVVEAGVRLFAERGFEGAAMQAIADAAGVQVPLIVYHFGSKDALWRACVEEIYARVHAHIGRYADALSGADGLDFFRIAIKAHVTALAAHPEHMRILFQEGTQQSERLVWLVERHQSVLSALYVGLIERAQRENFLPAADPLHLKFVLSGAMSLPIALAPEYRMTTGDDPCSDAFIDRHVELCLRLLMRSADQSHAL